MPTYITTINKPCYTFGLKLVLCQDKSTKVKFLALELDHACVLCREQRMARFSLYKPVDSSVWTDTARKGLKIVLSVGDTYVY